jgi:hypothetical protein
MTHDQIQSCDHQVNRLKFVRIFIRAAKKISSSRRGPRVDIKGGQPIKLSVRPHVRFMFFILNSGLSCCASVELFLYR